MAELLRVSSSSRDKGHLHFKPEQGDIYHTHHTSWQNPINYVAERRREERDRESAKKRETCVGVTRRIEFCQSFSDVDNNHFYSKTT